LKVLVACANWKRVTSTKFISDLDTAIESGGLPHEFIAVCGGSVSTDIRDKIEAHARAKGVTISDVWAGVEFEERIRRDAESLLRRFVGGEVFPDDARSLGELLVAS